MVSAHSPMGTFNVADWEGFACGGEVGDRMSVERRPVDCVVEELEEG